MWLFPPSEGDVDLGLQIYCIGCIRIWYHKTSIHPRFFHYCREELLEWYKNLAAESGKGDDASTDIKIPEEFTAKNPTAAEYAKMKASVKEKIEETLKEYKNMDATVGDEQEKMLDEMKKLYIKAKEVSAIIGSRDNLD